jgi:(E)-4-hydroxy-3-methylbut-2-enyl-diphosphate synthase
MKQAATFLKIYRREQTRRICLGGVPLGGGAPVVVQSMTNTDTRDAVGTLEQIDRLHKAGCELVRVAVPDLEAADALESIVHGSPVPVIADIHFQGELATAAMERGVAGIRINPGTLSGEGALKKVAVVAGRRGVTVRVGVNSGSLESGLVLDGARPEDLGRLMAESALSWCEKFEAWGCGSLKVSLKSSSVLTTIAAYRYFAGLSDIPTHVGLTEAGSVRFGGIKSAVALGCLLLEGIGDTIRVSLTGDPVPEVATAYAILGAAGLRFRRPDVIACPTCGRTEIDLAPVVAAVEDEIDRLLGEGLEIPLRKIAVMGCVVNGPGEARDADIGIAGGRGCGVLFKNGEVVRKLGEDELASTLIQEIRALVSNQSIR